MVESLIAALRSLFQPRACGAVLEGCASGPPETQQTPALDPAQVQELICKVSELTCTVAQDVGQHSASIQSISNELTAVAQTDPNAVATLACKLLMANQELQARLQRAETALQNHSHELQLAMTTARTDGLTGLMNRRALDEQLMRCMADFLRHRRPSTLLMLDVDRFKQFNDAFGHLAGDQALIHVGNVLKEHSRATDFLARFGGEEFAVIFTAATAAGVKEKAEGLRASIGQKKLVFEDHEMEVRASAGLAEVAEGETIADWLRRADDALYAAKKDGRNCSFLACDDTFQRIVLEQQTGREELATEQTPTRSLADAAAELAAESFADTGFVPCLARRIAEWKRGGTTLTVVLLRLDNPCDSDSHDAALSPTRRALQMARACSREMDGVTRWLSDGVALLLPGSSLSDAKNICRRLKNSASAQPPDGGDTITPLSFCVGIAEGIEGNDSRRVLERAWLALEAARTVGHGNTFIHDGVKTVPLKMATAAALAKA